MTKEAGYTATVGTGAYAQLEQYPGFVSDINRTTNAANKEFCVGTGFLYTCKVIIFTVNVQPVIAVYHSALRGDVTQTFVIINAQGTMMTGSASDDMGDIGEGDPSIGDDFDPPGFSGFPDMDIEDYPAGAFEVPAGYSYSG